MRVPGKRLVLGLCSFGTLLLLYSVVSNLPTLITSSRPSTRDFSTLADGFADGSLFQRHFGQPRSSADWIFARLQHAIVLGVLMGWFRTFEYLADPLVEAVRPIPPWHTSSGDHLGGH